MRLWLSAHCTLKDLAESPSVYDIRADELYELDEEAFTFLAECSGADGAESDSNDFIAYCLEEGILGTEAVKAKRPPVERSPEPSLRYIELQVTRRCNLRCAHCYIGPPEESELSPAEARKILNEFERMQGLRVLLSGGEPLMHREFQAINEMLPDFALRTILFTNGTLLTDRVLEGLMAHEIQISIDGIDAAHDAMRGSGSHKTAMDAIRRSIEHGFEVSVSTMVHKGNLDDFDHMRDEFMGMGIKDWTVDVPCAEGNLKDNPAHALTPEQAGKYLGYGFGGAIHGGAEGFACGRHLMAVMADGGCAKCAFYADSPVGSINDGLALCWGRVPHYKLTELECDCAHLDECRGGCRYRAALGGTEKSRDLYRCALYGII